MLSDELLSRAENRVKGQRFGLVTANVVGDPSISHVARLLYSVISTYCDRSYTWVSINTLVNHMNVSHRTVSRGLKELQEKGVILRFKGDKISKSTLLLR